MSQPTTTTALILFLAAAGLGCGDRLIGQLPPDGAVDQPVAPVDASAGGTDASAGGTDASAGGTDASDAASDLLPDANAADRPSVIPDLPEICTAQGWCWTHPLPTSDRFVQAFGVGTDDVWLIGASGTVLRFSGGAWSAIPPPPTDTLAAIWASAASDVWVGGLAGSFRWDGGAWALIPPIAQEHQRVVQAIWGCAPNDVWNVGYLALRWDGNMLTYPAMTILPGELRAVWGSGCDDVWAGTLFDSSASGRVMHWDGSAWTDIASQPAERIAGTGPGDVWSLAQGRLHHWTGLGTPTLVDSRTLTLFPVGDAAVATMNDGRFISVRGRGGTMSLSAPAPDTVGSFSGSSAADIWGVGALGAASHWDGSAWTDLLPGWTLTRDDVTKVTGSSPTDLWAATAGGTLLHGDGSTWWIALTSAQVGGINDVWARVPEDVWVLGGDKLIHRWNGAAWRTEDPLPLGTPVELRAISGSGPNDVWILRDTNSVLHWDGDGWISQQPDLARPVDLWAAGPDDAWVVGDDGVRHWDGSYWRKPRLPAELGSSPPPFTAVAGSGPTNVWIIAAGGHVLKANTSPLELVLAQGGYARAVTSLTPVPTGGAWVLYQDGTARSRLSLFPIIEMTMTVMTGPAGLNDIWLAPDGTLWAAGSGGALLRKRPSP